jgi:hypothetical protein
MAYTVDHTPASSASLTASSAALGGKKLATTTASSARLNASAVNLGTVFYTYPAELVGTLTAATSVLRKNYRWIRPTLSTVSLTTATPILYNRTKHPVTTASKVSLNASTAALGKTTSGVPTITYMSTIASSARFTASTIVLMPQRLIVPNPASADVTASSAGVTVTHTGYPATKYLSTYGSVVNLTTNLTILRRYRLVTPTETTVTLSVSDSTMRRKFPVTTEPSTVTLSAFPPSSLTGWANLLTTSSTGNLTASNVVIRRHRRGNAKHAHEHPRHGPVTIDLSTAKTTMKSPNMVERRMKKTRVGGAPWQQH